VDIDALNTTARLARVKKSAIDRCFYCLIKVGIVSDIGGIFAT